MNNASTSVAITLKQVQKTFSDGTLALKPLDLHIEKGEILVLLGPSGCGKTTTLRLIAGLEFCDQGGQILFGDRDVTSIAIEQRRVGMGVSILCFISQYECERKHCLWFACAR